MSTTEERLRAAARAAAQTVAPGTTLPPPRLPPRRRWAPRLRPRRGWPGWAAPLAAAAAVTTVVLSSIAVSGAIGPGRPAARGTGRAGGTNGVGTGGAGTGGAPDWPAARAAVPKYFVGLVGGVPDQQRQAVVAATATGKTLATIAPPKPFGAFDWVAAAGDDRTFVLAAQRWVPITHWRPEPVVFYRLVLSPSGHPQALARLPIRAEYGFISGIALSPGGGKLAVAVHGPGRAAQDPKIEVFSTATGRERQWVWPGSGWIGLNKPMGQALSWAADGRTLALQLRAGAGVPAVEVRLLDTAAPGASLRSSRLVLDVPPGSSGWISGNVLLTPDGGLVVAPIARQRGNTQAPVTDLEIAEFSAATGKPVRVLDRWASSPAPAAPGWQDVLWAGPGGDVLVVASPLRPHGGGTPRVVIGLQSGRGFSPLPAAVQKFSPTEIAW